MNAAVGTMCAFVADRPVTSYAAGLAADAAAYRRFAQALLEQGMHVIPRGLLYLSTEHGAAELELARASVAAAAALLPGRDRGGMTATPVIEADRVYKDYGHVQALRGASLQVHRGEIVALVGDNGAGKSTLLKAMCGARPAGQRRDPHPRRSRVELTSARVAHSLGVQTVYQDLALAPDLSVPREHLPRHGDAAARPARPARRARRVATMARDSDAALRALGIELAHGRASRSRTCRAASARRSRSRAPCTGPRTRS